MRNLGRDSLLVLLAAATVCATADSTKQKIYRNSEFGIVMELPAAVLLCHVPPGEHDHGPYMLLDAKREDGCHDLDHNRSIDLFASYNVAADAIKLSEFLDEQCRNVAGGNCKIAPDGLKIPGLQSVGGKLERSDGWIDVLVVTQTGTSTARTPGVNYAFILRTTANDFSKDVSVLRAVLRTVRLSPPTQ